MERLLTKGPSRVSPFTIPMLMPNAPPGNISLAFGARGTCYNDQQRVFFVGAFDD